MSSVTVSEALIVTIGGTGSGGAISQVAIAGMGKVWKSEDTAVATAVQDSKGGNLKVAVWKDYEG